MNLKEAFRYQTFLNDRLNMACLSVSSRDHAYKITKKHLRSKANPDAEDKEEIVDNGIFYPNDDVIRFMESLVGEKYKLTTAIDSAKSHLDIDIDASVESNKFRQRVANAIGRMLTFAKTSSKTKDNDYKFNVEGNQTMYYYEVETDFEEAYDRDQAKLIWHRLTEDSDAVSSAVDSAMINTSVDYDPPYNVNDSFEDMMERFLSA